MSWAKPRARVGLPPLQDRLSPEGQWQAHSAGGPPAGGRLTDSPDSQGVRAEQPAAPI